MRATLIYGAGDVRVEDVADPVLIEPTDALVRITHACVCGSDLWPYIRRQPTESGDRIGHEFLGVVEDVGTQVQNFRRGDVVVAPFLISDGTCDFCAEGLTSSCRNGRGWGEGCDAGQGEAARVPMANGTLYKLPVQEGDPLLPSLLTLSDVLATGHHAAVTGQVGKGSKVTVIGDGAVGLLSVLAARRLGAEQITLMGSHPSRTDLGREFGADEVIAERGADGVDQVLELTQGDGTSAVLECVGSEEALETSLRTVRAGGIVSRVGIPQYQKARLDADSTFFRNVSIRAGVTPARTYIPELLPDVLEGKIDPGRVFDRVIDLDDTPTAYQAMRDREALKVLIRPS